MGACRDHHAAGMQVQPRSVDQHAVHQTLQPVGATPDETGKFLQTEIDKWEKVITTAGVKPDA